MSSLNKAMLIGRLGQDPDVKEHNGTTVANLSLATSSKYKDANGEWKETTEWHRVVVWGKIADVVKQYTKKGSQIYVEGPIQTRKWQDKDGNDKYTTEIRAFSVTLLDSKSDGNSSGASNQQSSSSSSSVQKGVELGTNFDDMDDDLPF